MFKPSFSLAIYLGGVTIISLPHPIFSKQSSMTPSSLHHESQCYMQHSFAYIIDGERERGAFTLTKSIHM